ncbi:MULTISPECIES: hypothetical protein [Streptomyces]|uniref:hypothetical protein n=1 Tax=Streptomyces TaxID=1883 RepID=UPI00163C8E5A|nr:MULTISPECIES: hypothetical protein [Streptomyces]MBC2877049.1 hypothetical protein [Streptomyces sp. TYQ1024]UBI39875.1 hypothetical protein K7I03_27670 [Streptomyces mobaraensis]UKW32456.1 hypothetical protein MCU78_27605 [Streptomyces sp. TYQ1024]
MTDGFDFSPGAQIPISGGAGQTAATQALASAAYRDGPMEELLKANSDWATSSVKPPRISLFEPNLGEAFARAVQQRMLGGGRKPLIQSFGTEPQVIVEHCLAASRIRRQRDARLTVLMVVFGVLFLPGVLIWLGVFQLRRTLAGAQNKRIGALGTALLLVLAVLGAVLMVKMPFHGFLGVYLRAMMVAPIIGWAWAKTICERTAKDLRGRWTGLLDGGGIGAKIPEAVPKNPGESAAEQLRQNLERLSAEQKSNVVFYAGPKGILGMGTRWGSWQLAEELAPADPDKEIHPFRSWDIMRAVHDQLRLLERTPINTGGLTPPFVEHWVVSPIGEGAGAVSRPAGADASFQIRGAALQKICNEQHFGSGDRHYLGVQFVLWDGQLVITLLINVTVLHKTLRIEVTGHALGPIHPVFNGKPKNRTKTFRKGLKFWETWERQLPVVEAREVVRLAARAPLTWYPPLLEYWGGKLVLPEPFGLRHAWADKPWRHRFMADDALRAATPVLRVVHETAVRFLAEHGVNTERFSSRAGNLSGAVQDLSPRQADVYNA